MVLFTVQGSGIVPLMFLTYINEHVSVLKQHYIKVKLFADDVKMYVRILDDLDVRSSQLALDALAQWSDAWQLPISINKCCVLYLISVMSPIILMLILMAAPYLSLHIPVTWGPLYQVTCLLLYILQTLFPRPTNELV